MSEQDAPEQITPRSLDDYLEVMSKSVFQAGISWRVVDSKWPDIRHAFKGFDAETVANFGKKDIDRLVKDPRVIRNRRKLGAIVENARRMVALEKMHDGFRNYLRSHASFSDTVKDLRNQFKFLGNMGCYRFLYVVGEQVPPYKD